ncbi:DMT family transporter [Neobacillus sp. SM06]|uniref:DMT family transporter n=1 Tax=Neobacillus sp. SM06 TaxID=3422492 RepID=UPI003D276D62
MPIFYAFILLITSFFWGANFVFSKFLIGHASPITLTILRWIIAVLFLFPLVWKKEKKLSLPKESLLPLLLMGLTGVVLFNIFQFLAIAGTSSINVSLISTMNPISIAIASAFLLHEKMSGKQMTAMAVSFFGVLVVLTKGDASKLFALRFNIGDLWMVTAVMIWGIYSICAKWAMKTVSPMAATFYSGLFGVLILLPFNLTNMQVENINLPFLSSLVYTGLISTVVCMLLWNMGVQKVGATNAGIFLNFNPVFTVMLAFLILNEKMNGAEWFGSAIVITGCYLFSRFASSKKIVPAEQANSLPKQV